MSKSRTAIAYKVFCCEAMDELPADARLLYIYLSFETNLIGEVTRPRVLARGLGFDDSALDALIDSGFVLAIHDAMGCRYFIAHHFENNSLSNANQKNGAFTLLDDVSEIIEFIGEPFKSAYRAIGYVSPMDSLHVGEMEPQELEMESNRNWNRIEQESNPNRIEKDGEKARFAKGLQ